MATMARRATEADLWDRSSADVRCELVDGEIVEMSPAGGRHGQICVGIIGVLREFVKPRALGRLFDSSTGFRLPNGNVRAPDVSFVAAERASVVDAGFVPLAPDLAVEVLSPSDQPRQVLDKIGDYLSAGTRLVWVVDPVTGSVAVYRALTDVRTVAADESLDGGDVLAGFRCRPADFLS
jgi:Uma2 family endonuclease